MKLEVIDLLNFFIICVVIIRKVLVDGFLMIGIDGLEVVDGFDWFCYYVIFFFIFFVGFCEINMIEFILFRGYIKFFFKWFDYFREIGFIVVLVKLFNKDVLNYGFCVGMKLEVVDFMELCLICVVIVI